MIIRAQRLAGSTQTRALLRWEFGLVVLILLAGLWSSFLSPYFLDAENLFDLAKLYVSTGLLALGLTVVVMSGDIDISIASNLALSSVLFGLLWEQGINVWIAALIGLSLATAFGFINGLLVSVLKLSAFAVTLGTLAAYKGVSLLLVGAREIAGFPEEFTNIGFGYIGDSFVPISLIVLIVFTIAFAVLLHATRIGRYLYVIGSNLEAARLSGVPVARVRILMFMLCGFMAGMAGLMTAGVFGSVRAYWEGTDLLDALTAVVMGGVSIFGGSGSIVGVLLALFLIAVLRNGMGVAGIGSPTQAIVVGVLLLAAMSIRQLSRKDQRRNG